MCGDGQAGTACWAVDTTPTHTPPPRNAPDPPVTKSCSSTGRASSSQLSATERSVRRPGGRAEGASAWSDPGQTHTRLPGHAWDARGPAHTGLTLGLVARLHQQGLIALQQVFNHPQLGQAAGVLHLAKDGTGEGVRRERTAVTAAQCWEGPAGGAWVRADLPAGRAPLSAWAWAAAHGAWA